MLSKSEMKNRFPGLHRFYLWLKRRPLHELDLIRSYLSDYRRYRKFSYRYNKDGVDVDNLNSVIMKYSHTIEKGFSLPEIRPGYGQSVIHELIDQLELYDASGFDRQGVAFRKSQSVLNEYLQYHDQMGFDLGAIKERIRPWTHTESKIGGYAEVAREDVLRKAAGNFEECAFSRSSVRTYSGERVADEIILNAVRIAGKTPSACNRQCWHTYIVRSEELKSQILSLQDGNRGFGDRADFVAVITADIRGFAGAGERHGTYIDGGLYAMSFLYALHYNGIGACPLNWMVGTAKDRRLRKILNLKPSENVIMMISAGCLPVKTRIAKSVRKQAEDQITFL